MKVNMFIVIISQLNQLQYMTRSTFTSFDPVATDALSRFC